MNAPPVKGLDGSTAITPTRCCRSAKPRAIAEQSVLLPTPGGPVTPIRMACPNLSAKRSLIPGIELGSFSTLVMSRAHALRSPSQKEVHNPSARAGETPALKFDKSSMRTLSVPTKASVHELLALQALRGCPVHEIKDKLPLNLSVGVRHGPERSGGRCDRGASPRCRSIRPRYRCAGISAQARPSADPVPADHLPPDGRSCTGRSYPWPKR